MAQHYYLNTSVSNSSSSLVGSSIIGTTWDYSSGTTYPIGWNGSQVQYLPAVAPPPIPPIKESPTAWLRRRVEEYRVDLSEVA